MPDKLDVSFLESVVRKQGEILKKRFGQTEGFIKEDGTSGAAPDFESQDYMVLELAKRYPSIIKFVVEEEPKNDCVAKILRSTNPNPEFTVYGDPNDGTRMFVNQIPYFSVSMGVEHNGELIIGIVYDPSSNRMFVAELGGGACMNGERLSGSDRQLKNATIGFPDFGKKFHLTEKYIDFLISNTHELYGIDMDLFREFRTNPNRDEMRTTKYGLMCNKGSTALQLAELAEGILDVVIHNGPGGFWDYAAGMVLVNEALEGRVIQRLDRKKIVLGEYPAPAMIFSTKNCYEPVAKAIGLRG